MAAHVMIFVIAIAWAVSLLIVSPHETQRKALRAVSYSTVGASDLVLPRTWRTFRAFYEDL
jgi:hypothetical protein